MNFKKGYKIKPKEVKPNGSVLFTDGTNDVIPNQVACEAYGYRYDTVNGTCYSFISTKQLGKQLTEPSNTKTGINNKTEKGTSRSIINGTLNTTKGFNENCLVSGKGNTVNNGMNNATAVGAYGKVLRQGEFVRGGGGSTAANQTQSSVIMLTCNTTDNSTTDMLVQGTASSYINLQNNSILGFEAYITRLETGGSSGTAGEFSYRQIKGVIRTADNYGLTIENYNSRVLGKDGVNGTAAFAEIGGARSGTVSIQVSDRNNVNNIWNATVYLHETKTNITF